MQAIPTKYKNIQFRSRLEATWACFFESMHWNWEYEPFDFNGWIPDFAITIKDGPPVLVEVKPIDKFDLNIAIEMLESTKGLKNYLLLIGYKPFNHPDFDTPFIGWLGRDYWPGIESDEDCDDSEIKFIRNGGKWDQAIFGCFGDPGPQNEHLIEFGSDTQRYGGIITGLDGNACPWGTVMDSELITKHVSEVWASSKNNNQWKSKNAKK